MLCIAGRGTLSVNWVPLVSTIAISAAGTEASIDDMRAAAVRVVLAESTATGLRSPGDVRLLFETIAS